MDEKLYRELGQLTKDKARWKQKIPYVASLLEKPGMMWYKKS